MNYKLVAAVLLLGWMLAACGGSVGAVPPTATSSPTATPTATPTPSPTPTPTPAPSPTPPVAPPPPAAPTATILKMVRVGAYSYAFSPMTLTIRHGAALTVTNTTAAPHTVTADGGAFNSGTVAPNATITMTFSTPGAYPFHCQIHPYMTGTLTVT